MLLGNANVSSFSVSWPAVFLFYSNLFFQIMPVLNSLCKLPFLFQNRSDFIQSVVAQCLVELSAARSTFRFSIQATDGTVYILVWLLNSDTLLMESAGNLESSNVFTLLESTTSSDSRSSEIWKAIKVLYHPCIKNRNKDLVDAWENDFGVHPLTFPSKTCLELLLILSQSNASLPPSLRRMDFFQVLKSFM
uniref:E3 ubiquitin-protein ligase E3D n=1 Tax=Varanus komodoensis TaxID=61221 RepID=A0A8D2LXB1_VARKO